MLFASPLYDDQVEHLLLDHPKGNVLDADLVGALRERIAGLARPALKLVVIEGAGRHFSFGASVPEHLPGRVDAMLSGFHGLFRDLEGLGVPTAAVVRGQCLGGGFELATWCGRVFCDASARFAVPEVKLGVFPPIAALGLRWRVGGANATRLVITGETVDGAAAVAMGLADVLDPAPDRAWQAWFEEHLLPHSAVAVRAAWRATRRPMRCALDEDLPALERAYLDDLMACADPVEGLQAFLDRRPPQWSHA